MRKIAIALLLALLPSLAGAQQFPTVPDHTVIGRVGTGSSSGPSQAIPFLNLNSLLGNHVLPGTYAADPQFGMKCNGVDDDSAALQLAVNTADANLLWPVYVPEGTCPLAHNVYLNKFGPPGTLTVPGMKLVGQGRGVTILDTRAANDYAISVNPAWKAAHQAAFGAVPGSAGALPSNTYYLEITENDGLGHEISVTLPKSYSIGSTGSLSIALPALPSGYSYNLYCDTVNNPVAHYCGYGTGPGNASAVAGGQTIVINSVGTARTIPTALQAVWQEASISNLSITNSTGATNASGIEYFKVGYSDLTNVYMHGLTGDGFGIQAYTGDVDGSFNVAVHNSKFDTIAGTCVNAAGNVLELSNFTADDRTVFNVCGTLPTNLNTAVTISSLPNGATPVVITSGSHNLLAGDMVAFSVTGMTLASTWYRVGSTVTGNSFNLVDESGNAVNTTGLGTFTGGSVSLSWRPPQIAGGVITGGGGCLAWTGLIGTFKNLDFTQCNNFAMYFTEAGASDNASTENVDFENTAGVGLYAAALAGGTLKNFECLSSAGLGNTPKCVQLGTGFAAGGVQNFLIDGGKVRSNVTPSIAFSQLQNTNIGATFQDTNRVSHITWQSFDATGQTRFSGFVFDPIPGQVQFSISAQNTVKLIPTGYGGALPLHPKSPGEWVTFHVPTAGVTGTVTGGLSATTVYNCFAHNSAATTSPYALSFACNSHATALDEGYKVDSTDKTWTFIGTANTDGSGNFQTGSTQTSWYPPSNGPTIGTGITNALAAWIGPTLLGSTNAAASGQIYVGQTGTFPAPETVSGDAMLASTGALTLATVNANTGAFGDATHCVTVTNNAKGLTTAVAAATCTPAVGSITGLGTGVATALAVNTGTAGSHVVNGGALGTPSSGTGTNLTGIPTTGLTGTLQAGQEPAHTGDMTNTAGSLATTVTKTNGVSFGNYATLSAGQLVNSMGSDVSLNNVANYFDGPSVAQGTTGTWFASGTVTVTGASSDNIFCKLWDGTTIVASAETSIISALNYSLSLSGFLAAPAANLRISCRDVVGTTGKIVFNPTGNGKDSTLTAFRIN